MKPDKTSPDQAVRIQAESRTFLADLQTPVGIYLKVRDLFPESALLESSDYHTSENSYSFIGIEPIARFALQRDTITEQYPDGRVQQFAVDPAHPLSERMNRFLARFDVQGDKGRINGLFGYTAYDCVSYFESVGITKPSIDEVPQMVYILYRYVIAVNHLRGEMTVTENRPEGSASGMDRLMSVLQSKNFPSYDFHTVGGVSSPITDEQYKEMVRKGIGSDARIGSKFLYPGCGYGGSCFPKDVKALAHTAHEHGYTMQVIEAVERVNERQKSIVFDKLQLALGDLRGKTVAVWGLAFKPETDDIREAPALVVIDRLLEAGATVRAYDPVAANESRRRLGEERVYHAASMYEAAEGADAVALITEWKQFRMPDWTLLRSAMRDNIIVDGRNILDKEEALNAGFRYYGIGK